MNWTAVDILNHSEEVSLLREEQAEFRQNWARFANKLRNDIEKASAENDLAITQALKKTYAQHEENIDTYDTNIEKQVATILQPAFKMQLQPN